MALTDPRRYSWDTRIGTTIRHELVGGRAVPAPAAGDGTHIPFPAVILDSDAYRGAMTCHVLLLTEDGVAPRYPGVDYVMEIELRGTRSPIRRAQDALQQVSPGIPRTPVFGGPGQVIMSVFRPSDLSREQHWTERVQVIAPQGVTPQGGLPRREVTVRYDYIPGR